MYTRLLSFLISFMLLGSAARAADTESYYAGVPANAEAVFVIDMGSLMAAPLVKSIEAMMSQGQETDPNALAMDLTEHTGATRNDLGKFVLSTSNVMALQQMNSQAEPDPKALEAADMVMAFQLTTKITPEQFDAWVKSQTPAEEQETNKRQEVDGGILYTNDTSAEGMALGMMPTGDQTILFVGAENSVLKAIKARKGSLPKAMSAAQALMPSLPNILILASPSEAWKQDLLTESADPANNVYIEKAQQFAVGLNIADGLKILGGVKFNDTETAKTAYTEIDKSITELKTQPNDGSNPMMMMFGSLITNLSATEKGDQISVSTEMGAMESQQMLMMLPMMFMGMQQGMGGGMGDPDMGDPGM